MEQFDTVFPTNTFAHADFSVLGAENLDAPTVNIDDLKTMDLNECYFSSAK